MNSAPGKLILAGEHAVVYGQPALAMPIAALRASVAVEPAPRGAGMTVHAPDLGLVWRLRATAPLSDLAQRTLDYLQLPEPDLRLTISSSIPIASGMGSGAAVGAALVRALAEQAGQQLSAQVISDLVYQSEKAFHGTPSGIDNTVVAYEQPILFQRQTQGEPLIAPLAVGNQWHFVVADSGIASETKAVVGDLRQRWLADPELYNRQFVAVGNLVRQIQTALAGNDAELFGQLLSQNHQLLQTLGVSAEKLDYLVQTALAAGAWGAKMSGAGWGGIMLALVPAERASYIQQQLRAAGAVQTWQTSLLPTDSKR
ncbi:MAG TPA: mevalonate kinase [Herpetosiphon sp.]|uniref:Mevalonate kinase n=1 Tax=Herpetosiphon aurantiacus (strain ATCC 23779 / DSM 785 / 114-95) TaxID=316274 RepID=A9AY65_HERA2|nr:mevalonate kinase [Herpetosiphon sp.]ABX06947.1 mevalonate kinase [Herpetosiphon aurantiacus DSM 785]HBW48591.1 mevalonate kinase [Herpetosiphon sp.]